MEGKHIRWLEIGKDLLIALLTASALLLLWASPLVQNSGLSTLFERGTAQSASSAGTAQSIPAAAVPVRMTVCTGSGLYGVQYAPKSVDALFDAAGPLLGEALWYAGEPAQLSQAMAEAGETRRSANTGPALSADEEQWRALLTAPHVYFGYDQPVPLSVLGAWLKPEQGGAELSGSARHILLTAFSDGSLALCWQDGTGAYYLSATGLDAALHLDHIIESVSPNNAFFAFEDPTLPVVLDPYTLFTGQTLYAPAYLSANPVPLSDSAQMSRLLKALSFSDINRAEGSDSAVYVDGEDTVRLYPNGLLRCHTAAGRYTAAPGLDGAVERAWALASAALEPLCGEARLRLCLATEEDGAYVVAFGYELNGSAVTLNGQDWAARFTVRDGSVTEFSLYLRSYTAAGEDILLLPAEKAAAALTALTDTPRELVIRYEDGGTGTAEPMWVGQ